MSLAAGQRLGSYEIVAPLGAGGMGEVYRARDLKLKREVAIKVLPADVANDRERLARFQREAEVLASLNHPHIAHVYGIEENALIMELVEGEDLSQRIARGAIPLDEALPIARQIAEALEAAHDHGVVHRDLKPANVKVRPDGTVKVLDFGLAKAIEPVASHPSMMNSPTITSPAMTMHGVILGTAAYMSPEQAKGKTVDRRADIWAFGCVLYEMLTGQRTFAGEDVSDTLVSVLRDDPRWAALPGDTPAPIRQLLKRCLQRDPQKRLPHIGVARLELTEGAASEREPAVSRQRPWLLPLVGGAVAGALAAAVLIPRFWQAPVETNTTVEFTIEAPTGSFFTGGDGVPRFAVSPDGHNLLYQLADGKGSALWVRSLDTAQAKQIPGTGADPSGSATQQAFWSPDARSIAYFDEGSHQLKRADREFGTVQMITDIPGNNYGGAWNDHDVIIMSGAATEGIFSVSAHGGAKTQVTTIDATQQEISHLWPQFFPDGRHFIYLTSYSNGTPSALFVSSLDGGASHRLVASSSSGHPASDGYVLYVREGATVAQRVDLDRGAMAGEPVVIDGAAAHTTVGRAAIAVSRTNVLMYSTTAGTNQYETRWVDRGGRDLPDAPRSVTSYLRALRLSPDDSVLAYVSRESGRSSQPNSQVWIQNTARDIETKLTDSPPVPGTPLIFSPDSSAFITRTLANGQFTFFRQPVSGATLPTPILTGAKAEIIVPYDWTPDGRGIVATRADSLNGGALWTLPIDPHEKPIPYNAAATVRFGASLSPDGKWLAYTSGSETSGRQIFLQPYPDPSGGKWPVSAAGGSHPRWSRDGRELFFIDDTRLMAVSVTTSPRVDIGVPRELFALSRGMSSDSQGSSYPFDVLHRRDGFVLLQSRTVGRAETLLKVVTDWRRASSARQ